MSIRFALATVVLIVVAGVITGVVAECMARRDDTTQARATERERSVDSLAVWMSIPAMARRVSPAHEGVKRSSETADDFDFESCRDSTNLSRAHGDSQALGSRPKELQLASILSIQHRRFV